MRKRPDVKARHAQKRNQTIARMKAWILRHKRLPRASALGDEKRLYKRFIQYTCESGITFTPSFRKWAQKYRLYQRYDKMKSVAELLRFIKANGRCPSQSIEGEFRLYKVMKNYCTPYSHVFDPKIRELVQRFEKCMLTGIPYTYRRSINRALEESNCRLIKDLVE